jgi:hypothetical protein
MIRQLSEDLLWSQVVARAWCDETLMKRLRSNPREVLAEHGMAVPDGKEVRVEEGEVVGVEDTNQVRYFTFTISPPEELTDEDLYTGAVAQCFCGACAACALCGRCACRCACRCW